MCLSLGHQNPSKTSEKMGCFDRVTDSLHVLYTANQETEGSQDRLKKLQTNEKLRRWLQTKQELNGTYNT